MCSQVICKLQETAVCLGALQGLQFCNVEEKILPIIVRARDIYIVIKTYGIFKQDVFYTCIEFV